MINLLLSVEKTNDFQSCPLLYYYKHEKKITLVHKKPALEEGDLMHVILAKVYTEIMQGNRPDYDLIYDLARNHAAKTLGLEAALVEETIASAKEYFGYYGGVGTWEILGVEEPFAKELYVDDNLRIVITGKNDLRVKTMSGKGPIAIVDHKYEGRFDEKPERDNQPLAYCWAYEVKDFIYNRVGKQKSKKTEDRMQRPWLNYSAYQITDWVDSIVETAREILTCLDRDKWAMRFKACNFRNAKCDFYDICNTTPDNREYKINTEFKDRKQFKVMEDK